MKLKHSFAAGVFAFVGLFVSLAATAQVQTWPQTTALIVSEVAAFPSDPIVELPVTFVNNNSARQIATIQFDLVSSRIALPSPDFEPSVINGRLVSFEYIAAASAAFTGRYRTVVAPLPANDTMETGTIIRFQLHEPIKITDPIGFDPIRIFVENVVGADAQGNRHEPSLIQHGAIYDARSTFLDVDGDGMPDTWELLHGLNPNDRADGLLDPDLDGLTNAEEYRAGTHIDNRDSDFDGVPDGAEVARGLDPMDGSDGLELAWLKTTTSFGAADYTGLAARSPDGGIFYSFSTTSGVPMLGLRYDSGAVAWISQIAYPGGSEFLVLAVQTDGFGRPVILATYNGPQRDVLLGRDVTRTLGANNGVNAVVLTFDGVTGALIKDEIASLPANSSVTGLAHSALGYPNTYATSAYVAWTDGKPGIVDFSAATPNIFQIGDTFVTGRVTSIAYLPNNAAMPWVVAGTTATNLPFIARFDANWNQGGLDYLSGNCGTYPYVKSAGDAGYVLVGRLVGYRCGIPARDGVRHNVYAVPNPNSDLGHLTQFAAFYNSEHSLQWARWLDTSRLAQAIPGLTSHTDYIADIDADNESVALGFNMDIVAQSGSDLFSHAIVQRLSLRDGQRVFERVYKGNNSKDLVLWSVDLPRSGTTGLNVSGYFTGSSNFDTNQEYFAYRGENNIPGHSPVTK